MRKKILAILFILCLPLVLFGCNTKVNDVALGTFIDVKLEGGKYLIASKKIQKYIKNFEDNFSAHSNTGYLANINNAKANEPINVDEVFVELFKKSVEINKETLGAFNVAIYPLVELWQFDENFSYLDKDKPKIEDIARIKDYCKLENFVLDEKNLTITKLIDEAKLDFGGIAKGFIADKCNEIALKNNVKKGIINIGGNIQLIGENYSVGITHPRVDTNNIYGVAKLSNTSVVTSGDYERYYYSIDKTERYHHIIDTKTGAPSASNVIAVTVIGDDSLYCDAYATAIMVNGSAWGEQFIKNKGLRAVIIKNDLSYIKVGDFDFERKE
ncbi:MAG: FAD:protein FMN transferase [Clostridia bacterium]